MPGTSGGSRRDSSPTGAFRAQFVAARPAGIDTVVNLALHDEDRTDIGEDDETTRLRGHKATRLSKAEEGRAGGRRHPASV